MMTNRCVGVCVAITLAVAGALMSGCQQPVTGPSLSATFQDVALRPTVAGLEGGENLCCCHLSGHLTNTSSITVDAELRFPAKGAEGRLLGTGIDILNDVPAGATRSFLAVGIPSACKDVSLSQVVADGSIRLKGHFQPSN